MEGLQTRATEEYVREHVHIDVERKRIHLPERMKEIYETDFRGKKDEIVMWLVQYLGPELRQQLEHLLSLKKKFSLSFDDFDWTPFPVIEQ